jgi:hypothetical protein
MTMRIKGYLAYLQNYHLDTYIYCSGCTKLNLNMSQNQMWTFFAFDI